MPPITLHTGEYLAIDKVPKDATQFKIYENRLLWNVPEDNRTGFDYETLPSGNYQLIGKCSDLTEEQWAGIVESVVSEDGATTSTVAPKMEFIWSDYDKCRYCLATAKESGYSLLSSYGLVAEETIMLKKIEG